MQQGHGVQHAGWLVDQRGDSNLPESVGELDPVCGSRLNRGLVCG